MGADLRTIFGQGSKKLPARDEKLQLQLAQDRK